MDKERIYIGCLFMRVFRFCNNFKLVNFPIYATRVILGFNFKISAKFSIVEVNGDSFG